MSLNVTGGLGCSSIDATFACEFAPRSSLGSNSIGAIFAAIFEGDFVVRNGACTIKSSVGRKWPLPSEIRARQNRYPKRIEKKKKKKKVVRDFRGKAARILRLWKEALT